MIEDTRPGTLYGSGARALQDELDSRRLADRLAGYTVHGELDDGDLALVADQSTVWIATVDADGWPDVSYKGGAVGFVQAVGRRELRIPIYDGNGMFRTLGNASDTGRVALLFLDPRRPWRMRVHGTGRVSTEPADLADHVGAVAVLIVSVLRVFPNCGRYIHPAEGLSPDVPAIGHVPPTAAWKLLDGINDALPMSDPARRPD